ncbi:MAG: hypothetical protein KDI33_08615 [Halioglobus sp.]|nr:hypothetical protein [Halioglobus sp.]
MRLSSRQVIICATCATGVFISIFLAGCTLTVPHSTQTLAAGALVDSALEPTRGCEALDGEWQNQGIRLRDNRIDSAILTGAMGVEDASAELAFADRIRIDRQEDGSLTLTALDKTSTVGSISIPAQDIRCETDSAQLLKPTRTRLAVDSQGALWLQNTHGLLAITYSYRFLPAGDTQVDCAVRGACSWGAPAPNGMATVIVGAGGLQAGISQVDGKLETLMLQHGTVSHAQTVYLLPGQHRFSVLVWTPGSYWSDRPQTTIEVATDLNACHVYVPVGWHREGSESWATLIDMGSDFRRDCVSTVAHVNSAMYLNGDASKLLVKEYCFSSSSTSSDAPPREFPLPGIHPSHPAQPTQPTQ